MNIRSALVAVPLIAIVSLVGCAQDASPGVSAARPLETRPAVDRQRDALVTDDISRAEYTAAFEAFASCMSEAGHPVYIHDRGVIVDYSYPYAGEVDGSFSRCYTTLFRDIDIAWQLAHEYESETIRKLIVCIAATGHRPAGDAEGVHRQVAELGIDPDACTRA